MTITEKLNRLTYRVPNHSYLIIFSYRLQTKMGNVNSTKIENLEIEIFDRFFVFTNNLAQITSIAYTSSTFQDCQVAIQKCKDDINMAKQTFSSKQNIDTIDEIYFVPIIHN